MWDMRQDLRCKMTENQTEQTQAESFRSAIRNLTPNPGAEMLRYGWRQPNILSLGQGEGCAPTPDFINESAYAALRDGKTHYGPVLGQLQLREAIGQYYQDIYGADIQPNRIFITGSGTTAMHLAPVSYTHLTLPTTVIV